MRILMLGWEFPPFVAGGLGTACAGLTKALKHHGHDVLFVLPKPIGDARSDVVTLLSPEALRDEVSRFRALAERSPPEPEIPVASETSVTGQTPAPATSTGPAAVSRLGSTEFAPVPAGFSGPYTGLGVGSADRIARAMADLGEIEGLEALWRLTSGADGLASLKGASARKLADVMGRILNEVGGDGAGEHQYGADLFGDAERYAKLVGALSLGQQFDVIHANDWLTYPAGMAVKALTGKPLVVHVHATEFDRSGEHINQQVYDIERAGMHGADRVIAVSRLTKSICVRRYGVDEERVDVVYNGVEQDNIQPHAGERIEKDDRIVLFLGRITMQKGPEYFIRAAKRVLEKVDNVKFVVAGSGDMAVRMIEDAASQGIGHKVLFTGFLRGRDVDRVFKMADCFVMPSVSEPFGIAPLEAMRNDTPVIVSKQSGVSEVLTHALKVDFWDTDEMANKIVAVLKYPPLSQTLREHGAFELRGLTWEGAATKAVRVYGRAISASD